MKKLLCVVLGLCFCFALSGCTAKNAIKKDIDSQILGITEKSDSVINAIEKKGISELSNYEIDTKAIVNKLLNSASIAVAINKGENTATATITVSSYDMKSAVELFSEKASEFKNSDNIKDLEKGVRYQRGYDDLNQTLEATAVVDNTVIIKYECNNKEWQTKDDVFQEIIDTIISDEHAKQVVEVYKKGYSWKYDDKNASQIIEMMKASGLSIGEIQAFDETTDPGGKLGRPGGYTSKANYIDPRLSKGVEEYYLRHDNVIDYDYGGTIEVFDTAELAKIRGDYLEELSKTTQNNKYYTYRFCNVVFRVGDRAIPSQAKEYEAAFFEAQATTDNSSSVNQESVPTTATTTKAVIVDATTEKAETTVEVQSPTNPKPSTPSIVGTYTNGSETLVFYSGGSLKHLSSGDDVEGYGSWSQNGKSVSFSIDWEGHEGGPLQESCSIVDDGIMWGANYYLKVD